MKSPVIFTSSKEREIEGIVSTKKTGPEENRFFITD